MPLGFLVVLLGMAGIKTVPAALKLAGNLAASGFVSKELGSGVTYVAVDVDNDVIAVPRSVAEAGPVSGRELRLGLERAQVLKRPGKL